MSRHIDIRAVPSGTIDWALANAPLPDGNELASRSIRGVTDGPPHVLIGGAGIGPGWRTTRAFYEALTGEELGVFWGSPAHNRYKRALIGGDVIAEVWGYHGSVRMSTPEEAAEAVETVREIDRSGGPCASRQEIARWDHTISLYVYFFERYQPGEEVFYLPY